MSIEVRTVTVDCTDVAVVAAFWSAVLELPLDPSPSPYVASLNANGAALPRMLFLKVPEPKTVKNRMHLDLVVQPPQTRAEAVARLVELGGTHVADKDEWGHSWVVLTDPEGNEFCLAD